MTEERERRYRWIVFDADGTLFDYDRAEATALRRAFAEIGLELDARLHECFVRINSRLWQEFEQGLVSSERLRVQRFEELAAELRLDLDPTVFSEDYLHILGLQTPLLPGALALVESLAGDFRLALATNGIASVQRARFGASVIRPFFHTIVISDEIGVAKPDPRFFEALFAALGNPPRSQVLMVGDGLSSDIKGGVDFGIDTCWFNPSRLENSSEIEPSFEIHAPRELVELLEGRSR
jgi:putative hydrolase of the HAD superfamily